ncbi:hypothetical protein ACFE04_027623 [Oxalis oulophora]
MIVIQALTESEESNVSLIRRKDRQLKIAGSFLRGGAVRNKARTDDLASAVEVTSSVLVKARRRKLMRLAISGQFKPLESSLNNYDSSLYDGEAAILTSPTGLAVEKEALEISPTNEVIIDQPKVHVERVAEVVLKVNRESPGFDVEVQYFHSLMLGAPLVSEVIQVKMTIDEEEVVASTVLEAGVHFEDGQVSMPKTSNAGKDGEENVQVELEVDSDDYDMDAEPRQTFGRVGGRGLDAGGFTPNL